MNLQTKTPNEFGDTIYNKVPIDSISALITWIINLLSLVFL